MQCFIGIPIPERCGNEIKNSLDSAFASRRLPGRLVAPLDYHITLRLLGQTTEDGRKRIAECIRQSKLTSPFSLVTGGLDGFPDEKHAKVLWLNFRSGLRHVGTLREEINWISELHEVPEEPFHFDPHITIARCNPATDIRTLRQPPNPKGVVIPVASIALFKSIPTEAGCEYTILEKFDLPK